MKCSARLLMVLFLIGAWMPAYAYDAPPSAPSAAQVNAIYPELEALYIDLHRNPELGFNVQQTAGKLAERMRALGYEVTTGVGRTGVVAVLKNGQGPTVMLRTDMDALPVQEKTGWSFASTVVVKNDAGQSIPVMHACGHDIHMASWTGTATLMAQNRNQWHGTLVMIAQPAEEIVEGASAMLKDGLYTRFPKPDFVLGLHDDATLPAGTIGYHSGFFRASSDEVDITIFGRGGHGAAPHETVDPIVIAARTVLAFQTIVSRENNPMDPAVITVGSIHGGTKDNIIPDQVKLQMTVRTFNPQARKRLLAAIARVAKAESQSANAPREPLVTVIPGTDVVNNDPALTSRVVATLRQAMGPDKIVEMPAKMTSEDFSQYGLAGVPALLLHVGASDPAKLAAARQSGIPVPGTHSPEFAPEREPTIKAAVTAETISLMNLLDGLQKH